VRYFKVTVKINFWLTFCGHSVHVANGQGLDGVEGIVKRKSDNFIYI